MGFENPELIHESPSETIRVLQEELAQTNSEVMALTLELDRRLEELRASEATLASLLNLTHDAIFVRDMSSVIKYWNRAAEELYGWPAEEAVGERAHDLLKSILPLSLEQIEGEVLRKGRWEGELVHTKKDGGRVVVASRWSLQRNEKGSSVAILETNSDISDRKRAEFLLAGEKQILEMVAKGDSLAQILDGLCRLVEEQASGALASVLLLDSDCLRHAAAPSLPKAYIDAIDSVVIGQSVGPCTAAACRGEQVIVEDIATDPLWADYRDLALLHSLRACWFTPVFSSKGKVIATFAMYFREPRRPSRRDRGIIERIVSLVGVAIERKLAEDKLRANERSLRELTETIPQMLWSADAGGAIDYCNQRVLEYTGLSSDQVRGSGWMKTVHQDDVQKMAQAWTASVSTGEPFQYEFRCMRAADHTYRWCIARALPLRGQNGCIIKWFGSVVDLHDWKEAQQALQMMQTELANVSRLTLMGELAASIAHEVNQPLTAVTNNGNACLRLLANRSLKPEILRRALEEIVAEGTRASAVVARIRAFIKKTPAEKKNELDINEVIQEVLTLARRELDKNRVLLECQLTKAIPLVLADRIQLQQVLLNLIMNGIEAMTAITNQPRVLWVESRVDQSGDVLVAVRDSGPGLGSEVDRVFVPFFTTKGNGMGMGLPISRSLIESHGGRLWATPNSPQGAVFSFTLPVARGSPS
jgi:PAS domain S-box-containing protein